MRLNLRDIKNFPGKQLDFSYKLTGARHLNEYKTPVNISGSVKNNTGVLVLEGAASGTLSLVCDRCGEPFERDRTLSVSRVLSDSVQDTENDEIYVLSGDSVETDDIFIPELILDREMKTLCSEDCSGGHLSEFLTFDTE